MVEPALRVANVRLRPADEADQARGLLGFLAVELVGGLTLDGLTLRRSARGVEYVCYPARKDASGERRYAVRPANEVTRRRLEGEILAQLGVEREGGP